MSVTFSKLSIKFAYLLTKIDKIGWETPERTPRSIKFIRAEK